MSTIRVDNFGPSAGGTTYSARGIAKAWVNFNGTGTIAVRDSLNGSSLTDNGTGRQALNFTSSFSDTNYMSVGAASSTGSSNEHNHRFEAPGITTTNASWKEIQTISDGATAFLDATHLSILCHGDLA